MKAEDYRQEWEDELRRAGLTPPEIRWGVKARYCWDTYQDGIPPRNAAREALLNYRRRAA